ncbi:SWF or SNF family helicase [Streptomyces sp. NRRL F-5727]|uniref:SWIM zinc finger family protein n=1 Tax=Streptomyces sp. NRRL F-5727 TaxID=1463871 RepID=UPI00069069A0|nr:SWF or SNF family helicase [Streptomyces sp. NRRL F-5727]
MSEYGTGHEAEELTIAAPPPVRGGAFTRTWWGRAWLKALEDTALDGRQVKAGRAHARAGAVGAVSVRPGRITAVVQDRDGTAYRSDVLVRTLTDEEWDRLLDLAVDSAGHIAALLDHEMPPHLVEDAAAVGVELLPGIGDLEPECGCEAWDHCPHTVALCHQMARILDEDPFALLLMRGRGQRAVVDALQERSAARAGGGAPSPDAPPAAGAGDGPAGVSAAEAYALRDILPPLPAVPVPEAGPGEPPSLDTETDPEPGVEPAALEFLAADTAARAHRLLTELLAGRAAPAGGPAGDLTVSEDAVRLAAGGPPAWVAARLASRTGRSRAGLDAATRAWRWGGAAALAVLEESWTPDEEALARAAARLADAWEDGERPELSRSGARWTAAGARAQLRLGEDGRWWPFRRDGDGWSPAGPADRDPAAALSTATGEIESEGEGEGERKE